MIYGLSVCPLLLFLELLLLSVCCIIAFYPTSRFIHTRVRGLWITYIFSSPCSDKSGW